MPDNNGFLNEDEIVLSINKHKFYELNPNLQKFVSFLFPKIKRRGRLKASRIPDFVKPDIAVTYKRKTEYVSLKSWNSRSLHEENIYTLLDYMRSIGITNHAEKMLLIFLYGDGTIDGTGEKREEYDKIYQRYKNAFIKANHDLNAKYVFVEPLIDRIMFQGVDPKSPRADFIYIGDVLNGIVVSRYQILRYIKSRLANWSFYESPHVGPVMFRAVARYIDKPIENQERRKKIGAVWPRMRADIEYISKNVPHFNINVNAWWNPK